jgi:hypothetical protein
MPVDSEAIHSIGYRYPVLEVEFEKGSVYQYSGVPKSLYRKMVSAESKGHFFMTHVRDQFPFRRIDPKSSMKIT